MTSRAIDLVSPKFVKARNETALATKMADMIISSGNQYDFYNFYEKANGEVVAWYREKLEFTYTKHLNARRK